MKIKTPTVVKAHGNIPKVIKEFVGAVNTNQSDISIAKMESPKGWTEPGQTPEFDEYTFVIRGQVNVETKTDKFTVNEGETFFAKKGEWVRYSTPDSETEYLAVCTPAFTPDTVNRDEN